MTARLRRQARLLAAIVLSGIVAGLIYTLANGFSRPIELLIGVTYGVLIAGPFGLFQVAANQGRARAWLRDLPLPASIALRSLVYAAVILTVQGGSLGHRVLGIPPDANARDLRAVISYSVGIALLLNAGLEIATILGPRTMWRFLTGRYHRPREEFRFVLMVDVAGSTAAAERLGNLTSHRLLDRVFRLASGPVLETSGEIHSYVGDEMIVTWPPHAATRPLVCFLAIRAALAAAAPAMRAEFGLAPEVRGSLHYGPLVVGEIGDIKRSIVLQGDVMNTAARLEAASRSVPGGFIVSADALARMGSPPPEAPLTPLGALDLRGRVERIEAYGLTR